MGPFWLGLALGVLLTIPFILIASRRTERRVRHLEQRARSADRISEQSMLTGGLAHEIKNPLSSINLNIQLLQEDLVALGREAGSAAMAEKVGRIQRRFESLSRETHRLRTILDDFLRFAGRMKLELAPTDVNELLRELVDFFQPQAQSMGVTIRTQLDSPGSSPDNAAVPADERMLKQAILNLMINACQAMAVARDSGAAHGGATEMIVRTDGRGDARGEHLEIHITDTGPGIAPADQPKIFQPYFSTKRGGTGLGLPTARRIVEEHRGSLTVHSEPGKGSDFVVSLPAGERESGDSGHEAEGGAYH